MNKKNIIQYHKQINRPLVLDGAIGSLLQQHQVIIDEHLWSSYANIVEPEKVIKIHNEYVNAGADIITTNTFRTNPLAFNNSSVKISNQDFVKRSIQLAQDAVGDNKNIFIAGSNPPAEDSYQNYRTTTLDEIIKNHKTHIDMLWENGVDFILNETQSHADEIKIICDHCSKNNIPFVVSLFVSSSGKILSGESVNEIIKYISNYNPIAIGINCVQPETFFNILPEINSLKRWGFYLNCGSGKYTDKEILEGVSPLDYLNIIKKNYNNSTFFIGSCCGSSPKHTTLIKEYLVGNN